jgi:hypothetical protein
VLAAVPKKHQEPPTITCVSNTAAHKPLLPSQTELSLDFFQRKDISLPPRGFFFYAQI